MPLFYRWERAQPTPAISQSTTSLAISKSRTVRQRKKQIGVIFGQPAEVHRIAETGESYWRYYQVTSTMNPSTFIPFVGLVTGGNDLDITQADFYFDAQEVLIRSQREQRRRYQNQWLGLGDAMTRSGQVDLVKAEMERLGLPFDQREASLAAGWADAAD